MKPNTPIDNLDRLILMMVGRRGFAQYKAEKLPDQVFSDLLRHLDVVLEKIIQSRRMLIKLTAEHLRAQLGDETENSDRCRMFCAQLSTVNTILAAAEMRLNDGK